MVRGHSAYLVLTAMGEVIVLYTSYPRVQFERRYTVVVQFASIDVVVVSPIPLSVFLAHHNLIRESEVNWNNPYHRITVLWPVSIAITCGTRQPCVQERT